MKKSFIVSIVFSILLLGGFFFVPVDVLAYANTAPIDSSYNNVIISDWAFTNTGSMTENDIKNFLVKQVPVCDTWHPNTIGGGESPPWTCLKDYVDPNGKGTAAHIIFTEAVRNGLNPQVLLVTLQKENSLITDSWPFLSQYNTAMGYGCFESTPGECTSYGFYNQVRYSSMLLRSAFDKSCGYANYGSYPNTWGENPALRKGNTATIDGRPTYIGSCATGSLYNYTPHRPDSAWLTAASDGSYYYGNYNFVNFFNNWFPNWMNPPVLTYSSGNGFWNPALSNFSVSGDFNGDGKDDVASLYDYGNGKIGIWSFESNGSRLNPRVIYTGAAGYWDISKTKYLYAGDFNGDGKTDIGALYDYGKGKIGIWSFESNGTTLSPRILYMGSSGYWDTVATKYSKSGDFNGDGKDDVTAVYDYGNGKIGIWSFESNGTILTPKVMYMGKNGYWDITRGKMFYVGDFNGDKKDDVAGLYDYGNEKIGVFSFESNGATMVSRQMYISVNGAWNVSKIKFSDAGDFDKNGKDDIGLMYDYGNGYIKIWDLQSGGFAFIPNVMSRSTADCWDVAKTKWILAGDYNGDGKSELSSGYDYGSYRLGIWRFGY